MWWDIASIIEVKSYVFYSKSKSVDGLVNQNDVASGSWRNHRILQTIVTFIRI